MTIIRVKHEKRYTCISNSAIRDKSLSFKARGLHHLLLSYPDNWQINSNHLVAQSDLDGKTAILSALRELEDKGYLTRQRCHDDKGHWVYESIITETPKTCTNTDANDGGISPKSVDEQDFNSEPVNGPDNRKPTSGKPAYGKPAKNNTSKKPSNKGQTIVQEGFEDLLPNVTDDGKPTSGKPVCGKPDPIISTDQTNTDNSLSPLRNTARARENEDEERKRAIENSEVEQKLVNPEIEATIAHLGITANAYGTLRQGSAISIPQPTTSLINANNTPNHSQHADGDKGSAAPLVDPKDDLRQVSDCERLERAFRGQGLRNYPWRNSERRNDFAEWIVQHYRDKLSSAQYYRDLGRSATAGEAKSRISKLENSEVGLDELYAVVDDHNTPAVTHTYAVVQTDNTPAKSPLQATEDGPEIPWLDPTHTSGFRADFLEHLGNASLAYQAAESTRKLHKPAWTYGAAVFRGLSPEAQAMAWEAYETLIDSEF